MAFTERAWGRGKLSKGVQGGEVPGLDVAVSTASPKHVALQHAPVDGALVHVERHNLLVISMDFQLSVLSTAEDGLL